MIGSQQILAEGISDYLPWYTWVCLGFLIVVLVAYKMYQKKMME